MKKYTLGLAILALIYAAGCSDDSPKTPKQGDSCNLADYPYSGTLCHKSRVYACTNGKVQIKACQKDCQISNNIAVCIGEMSTCGNIDDKGICEGNVAKRCHNGEIVEHDCSLDSKVCGRDAALTVDCVQATSECGEIDAKGICENNVAKRCQANQLIVDDCSETNQNCGRDFLTDVATCIDKSLDCGDIDIIGKCDDNAIKYCNNGKLVVTPCPHGCLYDDKGTPDCATGTECTADFTVTGKCEGEILKYCDNKVRRTYNCAMNQQVCGYVKDGIFGYFDCIDATDPCRGYDDVPICNGNMLTQCVEQRIEAKACTGGCLEEITSAKPDLLYGFCTGPCGSITEVGECRDNTVVFCNDGTLIEENCSLTNRYCRFSSGDDYFGCSSRP
ncbi:MAG: hypothetical protein FWC40_02920 [Proteobacteria bacterium]|nr:hypothetical protein [Pseudomonadota bacterium]